MRWTLCLAASSLALTLLMSCKSSGQKPGTQQTAERDRKTTPISKEDAESVQLAAERFLLALRTQNFDEMWGMIAEESRKQVGLATFVKQNSYAEKGTMISAAVESVEGLGPGRALVKTVINFQWAPAVFGPEYSEPVNFEWNDEWVRGPDGQWYRIIPLPDLKKQREAEEICANASKQSENPFLQ